jgi:ferritin heavy chain
MLIDLQNTRGGRVALAAIGPPQTEYAHADKGDALYAMEISLALERLNYEKLLALYDVADQQCDAQVGAHMHPIPHHAPAVYGGGGGWWHLR